MKKYFTFLIIATCFLFITCSTNDDVADSTNDTNQTDNTDSSTDDTTDTTDTVTPNSYFSRTQGDQWNYESTTSMNETTQDTLVVVGDVVINNDTFTDLEVNMGNGGFMTGLFSTGGLREIDAVLEFTGSLVFPIDDINEITIEIPLITLYDETVAAGILLDQVEQTVTQDIDNIPVTITTAASTYSAGIDQNVTINGNTFNQVIKGNLLINTTITATIIGIPVTILEAQDIAVIENMYAQNVGLVASDFSFNYEFVDLSPFGITLPFPQTGNGSSQQLIVSYEVAADD